MFKQRFKTILIGIMAMALFVWGWSNCAKKQIPMDPLSGKWTVLSLEESNAKTELYLTIDPKEVEQNEFIPDILTALNIIKKGDGSYFKSVPIGSFVYIDKNGFYIDKFFSIMAPKLEGINWQAYVKGEKLIYEGVLDIPIAIQEMMMDKNKNRFIPIGIRENKPSSLVPIFLKNSNDQMLSLQQTAEFSFKKQTDTHMIINGLTMKYKYQLLREGKMVSFSDSTVSKSFQLYLQKEKK